MSDEINFAFNKGSTLYARIFNSVGEIWNTTGTPAFEDWANGNVTEYDIALTDMDSSQYLADFPSLDAGRYKVHILSQAGGTPAITDNVVGTGGICWDGSAEIYECVDFDYEGPVTHLKVENGNVTEVRNLTTYA